MCFKKSVSVLILVLIAIYLHAQTPGILKWTFTPDREIASSPSIGPDGTIYVGTGKSYSKNNLYALRPDGSIKWEFEVSGAIEEPPAIDSDGKIYLGIATPYTSQTDNKLIVFNPNGTVLWEYNTPNEATPPAIDSSGNLYFCSTDTLYALDNSGSEQWKFKLSGWSNSPVLGPNETIYVCGYNSKRLYAIDKNGTEKWRFEKNYRTVEWPAIDSSGTIYICYQGRYTYSTSDHKLYALNPDGTEKWSVSAGNIIETGPSIGLDGTIYFCDYDGILYAIDSMGNTKWTLDKSFGTVPAIGSNGIIYIGADINGYFWAINPDGTIKWEIKKGDSHYSDPAIGRDGTIYVRNNRDDYGLCAIACEAYGLAQSPWPKTRGGNMYRGRPDDPPPPNDIGIVSIEMDSIAQLNNVQNVKVWLYNFGSETQSNFQLGYQTDNSMPVVENYANSISPNDLAEYTFQTTWLPDQIGYIEITVFTNLVGDENTANDTLRKTIKVEYQIEKDLGVSQIQLADVIAVGSSNTIQVTITNFGIEAASNAPVAYQIDEENPVNETYTGTIDPGSSVNHSFSTPWIPNLFGDYTIKAYTAYAADENTANDTLKTIVLVAQQNDVGISEILVPSSVGVNRTVTINVELTNDGIQDQSNFPISYKIGSGNWITENFTSTLESQQKDVYSFSETWAPTSLGSYLISVKTELSGDQNTSNDSKQKTVDVSDVQEGWITQFSDTSVSLNSVYFPDTNNGWAVGEDGVILHTNDGGVSWSTQSSGTSVELRSVYFTDINNGWASGEEDGIIIHTNDGGENWSNQYSTNNCYLNGLYFMDANTGYAVGYYASWSGWNLTYYSRILHTTDGGENWSNQLSQKYIRIDDVHFSDQNNGWAVGDRFELWATTYPVAIHTTDGGDNWTTLYFETPGSFDNVFFIDANTGWIVGLDSTIIHTTDGGENWYVQPTGSSCYFQCIYFTDASTGWAVGSRGIIMHTTDGGGHWDAQTSGTSNVLRSVYFTDANTAWAVGYNIILHTKTGGVITGLAENDNRPHILPENFTLSQNYPNPFNARTTIEYQLPKKTHVSLKVYNVHGREILTLVRGQQPQGHYRIRFDSQNLSSGLYFYRLRAGHQILCKRMVILK